MARFIMLPTGKKTVSTTVSRKSFIRYQCCDCGKTTLHVYNVSALVDAPSHALHSQEKQEQAKQLSQELALQNLEKKDALLFEVFNSTHEYEKVNDKVTCPHCGKVQPWSFLPVKNGVKSFFALFGVICLLVTLLIFVLDIERLLPWQVWAGLGVAAAGLSAWLCVSLNKDRKQALADLQKDTFVPPVYYNRQNIAELAMQPPADPAPDIPAGSAGFASQPFPSVGGVSSSPAPDLSGAFEPSGVSVSAVTDAPPAKPKKKNKLFPFIAAACVLLLAVVVISAVYRKPKTTTFTFQELQITLSREFKQGKTDANSAIYDGEDVIVSVQKIPFVEMPASYTVEDIYAAVSANLESPALYAQNDPPYFTYRLTGDKNVRQDVIFIYRTSDAYWLVRFETAASDWETYRTAVFDWADTVEFTE